MFGYYYPMRVNIDDKKVKKGIDFQKKARTAIQSADYQEAYHLYKQAEASFRDAYTSLGDRVFFNQCSALRCLEVLLIEEDRVDIAGLLAKETEDFLTEWTDAEIRMSVTTLRRKEAFAFRMWRQTFSLGGNYLYKASATLREGNFENARSILDQLIENLKIHPPTQTVAKLSTLAKIKRELITINKELNKPVALRNLSEIATAYMRASDIASQQSPGEGPNMIMYGYWYKSFGYKYEAQLVLSERLSLPDIDLVSRLRKAESKLNLAVEEASKVINGPLSNDFPISHYNKLKFWHAVVCKRLYSHVFIETGNSEDFTSSVKAWDSSLEIARDLVESKGESALFPNIYYSLKDLELDIQILDAMHAFKNRDWASCKAHLYKWQQDLPEEFHWSWRAVQVRIRFLLLEAITSFIGEDYSKLRSSCDAMGKLAKTEHIGNVGRMIMAQTNALAIWSGKALNDDFLNDLCKYFPLDSVVDLYETSGEVDPLQSLPEKIYGWLDQIRTPLDEIEVKEFKIKLRACVECVLCFICDYHLQNFKDQKSPSFGDFQDTLRSVLELAKSKFTQRVSLTVSLESLKSDIGNLDQIETKKQYRELYERVTNALRDAILMMPLLIKLKESALTSNDQDYKEATPDWALHQSREERKRILLSSSARVSLKPGAYYLPPEWCKGNRLFCNLKKTRLLPVRFEPQWSVWEDEISKVSSMFEGVSYADLERAVELASLSKPEDDNKPRPKVGAVIIKGGIKIAEAYRNQNGQGWHAEEIAIMQCRNNNIDLEGSTIITTLEPCTKGRSFNHQQCAEMIIRSKVKRVVVGTLDPDNRIQGTSEKIFRLNGIEVCYFPFNLRKILWEMNQNFNEQKDTDIRTIALFK